MSVLFESFAAKGRTLFAALEERLETNPVNNDTAETQLEEWYDIPEAVDPGQSWAGEDIFRWALEEQGDISDFKTYRVISKDGGGIPYTNYINASTGIIVCGDNTTKDDTNPSQRQIRLTDILGQCWELDAVEKGAALTGLKFVWRQKVRNEESKAVAREATHAGKTRFSPDDDGFFAILGSDNGKGVARLLTNYCKTLGRKTIVAIDVLEDQDPCLCFCLEAKGGAESSAAPSSRAQKRKQARSASGLAPKKKAHKLPSA